MSDIVIDESAELTPAAWGVLKTLVPPRALMGVLGVCQKCRASRPSCCVCPDHDQPTHYVLAGSPVLAAGGYPATGVLVDLPFEIP